VTSGVERSPSDGATARGDRWRDLGGCDASGGLFAGGVMSIAWERAPAWRSTRISEFRVGFAHTLRRVDRLQPALLAISLVSALGFAFTTADAARTLAVLAAAGFLLILMGSVACWCRSRRRSSRPRTSPTMPSSD
jgi:hypothetical protein